MAGRSASVRLGGLLADRECGHADDRQVIVIDGDLALILVAGQRSHRLHVRRIDLGLVVADRVVAEFFGDAVALAVDDGGTIHLHLGKEVGQRQLVFRQRLEQALFDTSRYVDAVDHHHIPVAGLRLFDNCHAGPGALEFLDVDLDAIGLLEGLQQRRVGVIAPDQGVEIRSLTEVTRRQQQRRRSTRGVKTALQNGTRIPSSRIRGLWIDGHRVFSLAFWLLAKIEPILKLSQFCFYGK